MPFSQPSLSERFWWLGLPLSLPFVVVALPLLATYAGLSQTWHERRRRQAALTARCGHCGAVLGSAALEQGDRAWQDHVAELHRRYPHHRLRLQRRVHAVCTACGAEHGYDEKTCRFASLQPTYIAEAIELFLRGDGARAPLDDLRFRLKQLRLKG